jgi:hypothetical protein
MMAIECDYHPSWQQIVLLIAPLTCLKAHVERGSRQ